MAAAPSSDQPPPEDWERWQVRVTGTVQGVGFRPFVYRHAVALGLSGLVRNDSAGVWIDVAGKPGAIAELRRVLVEEPPPLAQVTGVTATKLPAVGAPPGDGAAPFATGSTAHFTIATSDDTGGAEVPVSVDTGTCDECLAEVDDPANRRYRYPFTNCTNCGPRYTIVISVPYDRPATTMAPFIMCSHCQREYDDPSDRRFHAQPNACPGCGPRLRYVDIRARTADSVAGALAAAVDALGSGEILAVKGIGGYHLAADATNDAAVAELRRRKARDDKPFAVMVPDVDYAHRLVDLSAEAAVLMTSPRRPIVLASRRGADAAGTMAVAPGVAPGLAELGVMLPYSALHHLLMAGLGRPLVMTSGNVSDEPIAYTDHDAQQRLVGLVDGMLIHDRAIHVRCDDSVVRCRLGGTQVLRRSRGYAPEPLRLPVATPRPLLAVGAELKNTVAVAKGAVVVPSHHIGDLEHLAAYRSFLHTVDHLRHLYGVTPDHVAHDLHPEYLSTKFAAELDMPAIGVQHHHAHVASCLVDHGRFGPVLGVAFDGHGFGTDGTLWGGEFLLADLAGFERVGHLAPVGLPGGTAAIREPWRMALAWAHHSCPASLAAEVGARLDPRSEDLLRLLDNAAGSDVAHLVPTTTSAGRLFDAAAALVTGRRTVTYEGQAAIELEALGAGVAPGSTAGYPVELIDSPDGLVIEPAPMVAEIIEDVATGRPPPLVAAAFHEGIAAASVSAAARLAGELGLATVVLTGGVFQNSRLTGLVEAGLVSRGLEVLVHRAVPANDGGISIGQAAIAAQWLAAQ
ncbi:MAG: carbamoyltransferase HypF [Acidimicrobiales bacterium]